MHTEIVTPAGGLIGLVDAGAAREFFVQEESPVGSGVDGMVVGHRRSEEGDGRSSGKKTEVHRSAVVRQKHIASVEKGHESSQAQEPGHVSDPGSPIDALLEAVDMLFFLCRSGQENGEVRVAGQEGRRRFRKEEKGPPSFETE